MEKGTVEPYRSYPSRVRHTVVPEDCRSNVLWPENGITEDEQAGNPTLVASPFPVEELKNNSEEK
jgi:hypothetical protein